MNLKKASVTTIRRMLLLFVLFFCLSLKLPAQEVKLNFKNTPLKTVLKEVSEQTGYKFVYSSALTTVNDEISISYESTNVSIENLLGELFKERKISYKIKEKQVILAPYEIVSGSSNTVKSTSNQEKAQLQISGKVVDDNNLPLPGVSILNITDGKATFTDNNGFYSIHAKNSDKIHIQCIGMITKEIVVSNSKTLYNIELAPDEIALKDVVVTGYQTISKERSAGSYAVITKDKIESKLNNDIMGRLEGSVAGMSMYKGDVVIRGTSTLYAEKKPLYVVDGIPFEGDIKNINPNDITNVSVLKDATAASIYGARSTNGVIVITTKSGSTGKLNVNYNGSIGISPLPDRGYANLMSSSEFIDYQTYFFEKGVKPSTKPNQKMSLNKVYQLLFDKRDGKISNSEFTNQIGQLRGLDRYDQVVDEFLNKNSMTTQHNLSFNGGSEFYRYSFSLNYQGTNPYEKKTYRERIGFNVKNHFNLSKRVQVDLGIMGSDNGYDYNSGISGISMLDDGKASYYMLRDNNGDPLSWDQGKSELELERLRSIGLFDETYFPTNEKEKQRSTSQSQYVNINLGVRVKILESLSAEVRYQTERTNNYNKTYWTKDSWYVKNMINGATVLNQDGTKTLNIPTGGQVRELNGKNKSYTLRGQLNFHQTIDKKHDISVIAGAERRKILNEQNGHYRFGYDDTNLSFKNINEVELGKGIYGTEDLWGSFWMPVRQPQYISTDDRFISFYSNASYTFNRKTSINASIRMDQSNLFGTDPKYQYRPLWSVGANYEIFGSNTINWLERLAVRATYGINGNVYKKSGPYIIAQVSSWPNWDTNETSANIISPPNSALRWEKTNTLNLGVDFNLLSQKLIGSLDFYNKRTSDMLGNRSADPTFGWDRLLTNYAQMRNTGVELVLESENIKSSTFHWNSSLLLSYNKNKITNLENASTSTFSYYQGVQSREGKPYNSLYSIKYAGLNDKGAPQAYKSDGSIVNNASKLIPEDLAYSGTYDPPYSASFTNMFRYKDLKLSFMFVYYGGHVMRDVAGGYFPNTYSPHESITSNLDKIHLNLWKEPGDEADLFRAPGYLPGAEMNIRFIWQAADIHIQKADYVKLRDLTLAYTLPKQIAKKAKLREASVILQAQNVWRWAANKNNLDPEVWYSSQTEYIKRGNAIPSTFTIGLNLSF